MIEPKSLNEKLIDSEEQLDLKSEILRYLSFWPWFLVSVLIFSISGYLYVRYTTYYYDSYSKVQIIDKAQDSEMALPTAMTIFNRSMINLENEMGVLKSYTLHERVVKKLKSNIRFYSIGRIKTDEQHKINWFDDYELSYNLDSDEINSSMTFNIKIVDGKLVVKSYDSNLNFIDEIQFDSLNTSEKKHELPFNLNIISYDPDDTEKEIKFIRLESTVQLFSQILQVEPSGQDSDQLILKLRLSNRTVAEEYLNTLINEFDKDGVSDRQAEYKRTIDFVNSRSKFLSEELELIENRKKDFKQNNNLADIKSDASFTANQQFNYDADLFKARSQKDLLLLLEKSLSEKDFQLMPINIGIENNSVNEIIKLYNELIIEREKYTYSAGINNPFIKILDKQIDEVSNNVAKSISNYRNSLDVTIKNLEEKSGEFADVYKNIPENEKILRSIERELEVKEALFLLLLQKREEAAINYAVVKPSIKVIDYAKSSSLPVSPNKTLIYIGSLFVGLVIPFISLYTWFYFDDKIHTKPQLTALLKNSIPVIGEIPFIKDLENNKSRGILSESFRMITTNFNFTLLNNKKNNEDSNVIIVTSSIKGEGKTIVSYNSAKSLSDKFEKVILVGADLRNPQIHKLLNTTKNKLGLSDLISKNSFDYENLIIKNENLDILLSGTIPPNPTELLASDRFIKLIEKLKKDYDYVVLDTAPCLMVADTLEIANIADLTIYVARANYSQIKLVDAILEFQRNNQINNINLIINGVGESSAYGYKYGYQYGYKYGYSYNYGYGYGYKEDSD